MPLSPPQPQIILVPRLQPPPFSSQRTDAPTHWPSALTLPSSKKPLVQVPSTTKAGLKSGSQRLRGSKLSQPLIRLRTSESATRWKNSACSFSGHECHATSPHGRKSRSATENGAEAHDAPHRKFRDCVSTLSRCHAQNVEGVTEVCYEHVYVLMLLTELVELEHVVHRVSQPWKHNSLTQPNVLVVAASTSSPRHPSP